MYTGYSPCDVREFSETAMSGSYWKHFLVGEELYKHEMVILFQ